MPPNTAGSGTVSPIASLTWPTAHTFPLYSGIAVSSRAAGTMAEAGKSAAPGTQAHMQGNHLSTNLTHRAAPSQDVNTSISLASFLKVF